MLLSRRRYFVLRGRLGVASMTLEKAIERLKAEYERAKSLSYVVKPLAYALYQVWKEADKKKTRDTLKSSESEDQRSAKR